LHVIKRTFNSLNALHNKESLILSDLAILYENNVWITGSVRFILKNQDSSLSDIKRKVRSKSSKKKLKFSFPPEGSN